MRPTLRPPNLNQGCGVVRLQMRPFDTVWSKRGRHHMLRHDTCLCGEKATVAGLCSACIRIAVTRQIERIQRA